MRLFPQFNPVDSVAINQLDDWAALTVLAKLKPVELELNRCSFNIDNFEFSSLGTKVNDDEINRIYLTMLEAARQQGYARHPSVAQARQVDSDWGLILHSEMKITRNEASKAGFWNALTCHYMPNLTSWRWENPAKPVKTPGERWITQERKYRHAFGRLWWRFEVLKDANKPEDPYWIPRQLQEDELGQLMERSAFVSIPRVTLTLARIHLSNLKSDPTERSESFRRAIKLLLLRATIRHLESLEVLGLCDDFIKKCYRDAQS